MYFWKPLPLANRQDRGSVIIADDDPLIRSVLRSKLEGIGQSVVIAKDGLEAVAVASRTRAQLILLDFNMPGLNGLVACKRIRAMPLNADTPIVALTALSIDNIEAAALRAGITMFLNKPIGMTQLLGVISRYLTLDDATRRAIADSAARASQIAAMPPRRGDLG
jgi:putative two-component system response regulator